jgi:hypothetical protein
MKHCPLCNQQYPDESIFCGDDGTRLEANPKRQCASCGEQLEAGANFCAECGAPCEQEFPHSRPTHAEQENPPAFGAPTGETFADRVAALLRSSFPDAVVREGFRIQEDDGTEQTADLLVVNRTGIFIVECQDYPGKIRGSLAYDYRKGELWTCQAPSGRIIQIPSDGKNPARQALEVLSVLRQRAAAVASDIHSVLVFPDGADLSGIHDMPVSPLTPSRDQSVSALTFAELHRYIAAGDGNMNPRETVKLLDTPRRPRMDFPETTAPEQALGRDRRKRPFKEGIKPVYVIGGAVAVTLVVLAALVLQFLPSRISKPSEVTQESNVADPSGSPSSVQPIPATSAPDSGTATKMTEAVTPNPASSLPPSSGMVPREASRPPETKAPVEVVRRPDEPAKIDPGFVKKESSPPPQASKRAETPPSSREAPIPRRAAEAGTYETIKNTAARMSPSDSSDVLDQLNTGTRLNVTGSDGEWLVVRSKTRNRTVYVHRDDAMLLPPGGLRGASARDSEVKWKEVENQIQQAIARRGITGVTVSFVGDTAYLRGKVDTEDQRLAAEQAARSMPEVVHIHNGIWLNR